jgi:type IV pilus assembly protein PilW
MKNMGKNGFSLIELLIAMAITGIVMVAIVSTYMLQVRSKNTQEALTDMNQTVRAALEVMTHEIRMAGLNPTGDAGAGITTARAGELIFSFDRRSNVGVVAENAPDGDCCDPNEQVRYYLTNDDAGGGGDGVNNAIADGVECHLGRETGAGLIAGLGCGGGRSGLQPLARDVDVLNFVYLDDTGTVIPAPVAANRLDDIRTIEVTIVARAGTESQGFLFGHTDMNAYNNLQGVEILPAQGDGFRRLQLSTTIACRNVGL